MLGSLRLSLDCKDISPLSSSPTALQPSGCTHSLLLETFPLVQYYRTVPVSSPATSLASPLYLPVLPSHTFMFKKFHETGSQLYFLLVLNFLVVFNNYQFFKRFYWLMIPNSNPQPRLPMELQTHKCNCLLHVSVLLSLKYHTHVFVQQTVIKYSVRVWPHLDRSKHISISTN